MTHHITMDNAAIHIIGGWSKDNRDDVDALCSFLFNHHMACEGWKEEKGVLLLHWAATEPNVNKFLTKLNEEETVTTIIAWLRQQKVPDELRDSDADETPNAFEAWTNMWGHGTSEPKERFGDAYAMIAIKPRTRWIGK